MNRGHLKETLRPIARGRRHDGRGSEKSVSPIDAERFAVVTKFDLTVIPNRAE